ncbi:MAG: hypothetical protein HRU43_06515 [Simkaniaceae bacterium]|nr:hypothetical protein [Simkaniaceae bacterium]
MSNSLIVGFIISACRDNFTLFDKRYDKLGSYLASSTDKADQDDYTKIYQKLGLLLDILDKISDLTIFGRKTKGIPPQTKISPVWKKICEGTLTEPDRGKMIQFYNSLSDDVDLKNEYLNLFKGTNGETGTAKIQKIVDFVLADRD